MFRNLAYQLRHSIVERYETVRRRLAFNRKQQADLLAALSKPMRVGRPPLLIARHLVKFGTAPQRRIAQDMITNLRSGKGVVAALEGWYDEVTLSALRAAEKGGPKTLLQALMYLSENMTKFRSEKVAIFGKWLPPGIYIVITINIMMILEGALIPALSAIGGEDKAAFFVAVMKFYKYQLPFIMIALVGAIIYARWWLANHIGPFRDTFDHIRLFSGYRLSIGVNVVSTFALLSRFDMKPFHIVRLLEETGSPYQQSHVFNMKEALRGARSDDRIGSSKGIVNALDVGLLDDEYLSLLKLYAEADDEYAVEALEDAARDIQSQVLMRLKVFGVAGTLFLWVWLVFNLITIVLLLLGSAL